MGRLLLLLKDILKAKQKKDWARTFEAILTTKLSFKIQSLQWVILYINL